MAAENGDDTAEKKPEDFGPELSPMSAQTDQRLGLLEGMKSLTTCV
jgi:hypothetical protein